MLTSHHALYINIDSQNTQTRTNVKRISYSTNITMISYVVTISTLFCVVMIYFIEYFSGGLLIILDIFKLIIIIPII